MNYSFEFDSAILNINDGFGQNYCNILSKGSVSFIYLEGIKIRISLFICVIFALIIEEKIS